MPDIKQRELKIQEKRRQTSWREFLMEIASWCPLWFYKIDGKISRYPPTLRAGKLISAEEFVEHRNWDMVSSDINADSFYAQLEALRAKIEKPQRRIFGDVEKSEYADTIWMWAKSCYLTICAGEDIQNILYSFYVVSKCSDVYNSIAITNWSQNVYQSVWINKSYNVFYSKYIYDSANIRLSTNMIGCTECILCDGLTNQSYCVQNKQYSKETYEIEKKSILQKKGEFLKYFTQLKDESTNIGSVNSTGMAVIYSENVDHWIFVNHVRNGKNLIVVGNGDKVENQYDCITSATEADHGYANMWVSPGTFMYCSMNSWYVDHIFYCVYVENCHHCLGCYGLKNKSFCIFNKQYTEEERFTLANDILEQMDKDWTLWTFFPWSMNPFYFNDTVAYLIDDSFTKEEVTKQWYLRRDEEIKVDIPVWAEMIETKDLQSYQGFDMNGERKINPEVLKKVICDEKWNYYRIVPIELEFLQKHGLPLPEIHWLERIKLGFKFK